MQPEALLSVLHTAEKLKGTFRHCQTANGHPESVAAHSWRLALLAYFIADEYPDADMNKVIKMCLIHDLGECFIGDIPSFNKTDADEKNEEKQLFGWVDTLPEPYLAALRRAVRTKPKRKSNKDKESRTSVRLSFCNASTRRRLSPAVQNHYSRSNERQRVP